MLLLVAGNETTRTVTVNGFRTLLEHPDEYRRLIQENPGSEQVYGDNLDRIRRRIDELEARE